MDDLSVWLQRMIQEKGSDIYITANAPAMLRIDDDLLAISDHALTSNDIGRIINDITNIDQQMQFETTNELNLSQKFDENGRFRINVYRQRGMPAIVIRRIPLQIPTIDELGLSGVFKDISCERKGLVLVVGGTGSGKSTTLASMIDHRNSNVAGHIITIEDPIEYEHKHKKSIISQREVGADTSSFNAGLKNALRQHPDVILIGEIRDTDTMRHAVNIAETGHLALATLHATSTAGAFNRILSFYEQIEHDQVLLNLSMNLRAIILQDLVRAETGGRRASNKILLNDDVIEKIIREGRIEEINDKTVLFESKIT